MDRKHSYTQIHIHTIRQMHRNTMLTVCVTTARCIVPFFVCQSMAQTETGLKSVLSYDRLRAASLTGQIYVVLLLYFAIRLESRKSANKRIYLSIYLSKMSSRDVEHYRIINVSLSTVCHYNDKGSSSRVIIMTHGHVTFTKCKHKIYSTL